jgi:nitrogen regulatory protein P-II 1
VKKIEAIIRPDRLQQVQDSLDELGVSGLTVTEVLGCGAQRGYTETYRGTPVKISLQRKVKVEAVMPDDKVSGAIDVIVAAARTGEVGDGKVFILPVEDAVRIRSGERGNQIVEHRAPQHWGRE